MTGVLVRYEGRVVEDPRGGVLEIPLCVGAEAVEEVVDEPPGREEWIFVGEARGRRGKGPGANVEAARRGCWLRGARDGALSESTRGRVRGRPARGGLA